MSNVLINGANQIEYVSFRANNAAEMAQKIREWLLANGALNIWDIDLSAIGAAPNFQCTLIAADVAGGEGSISVQADQVAVDVVGGVGTVDPTALAEQISAAIVNVDTLGATLYKMISAGGGAGPQWMALALRES